MSEVIAEGRRTEVRLDNREIFVLKFADDAAILSENESELQLSLDRTVQFSEKFMLPVNLKKTVCMIINGRSDEKPSLAV